MTETVLVERTLVDSVQSVWAALTDVDQLSQWCCANPDMDFDILVDARPGGRFRLLVPGEFVLDGCYQTVDAPHRLALTFSNRSLRDYGQRPATPPAAPAADATLSLELVPVECGTRVILTRTGLDDPQAIAAARGAWDRALGRLSSIL